MTRLDKIMVALLVGAALLVGGLIVVAVLYPQTREPMLLGAAGGAVVNLLGKR